MLVLVSCEVSIFSSPITGDIHTELNAPSPVSCSTHPVLYEAALSARLPDQQEVDVEEEEEEEEGGMSEVVSTGADSTVSAD